MAKTSNTTGTVSTTGATGTTNTGADTSTPTPATGMSSSQSLTEAKESAAKVARRFPSKLPLMVESKDPATIMHEVQTTYGFQVSEQFAADLAAFVEKAVKGDYTDK
jgi:hypothetical protein